MSKNKAELINRYQKVFLDNPESKVFAPLAEIYRSLGEIDQALSILKEGFRYHPEYSLGRLILGKCYFDQGKFELALSAISEVAKQEKDNLTLQQLYARVLRQLDKKDEALSAYKLVLFLNPREEEAKEFIENFEDELFLKNEENIHYQEALFDIPIDDWVSVDFTKEKIDNREQDSNDVLNRFRQEVREEHLDVESPSLDGSFLKQDFDVETETVLPEFYHQDDGVVSLKLVEMYCMQGAFAKAFDALGKIIDEKPDDVKLLKFYEELRIVNEKNLDCSPLYKLRFKLREFASRLKDSEYENSYY